MTSQPTPESNQAEIEAMRAEVEALQTQLAAKQAEDRRRRSGWIRSTAVVLLMVIGFVLTPVSIWSTWLRNNVYDTNTYVETVAPLASDPAVVSQVSTAVTNELFAQIDVESLLQQNLPPKLSFAAGPLADQIKSQTNGLVTKALQTSQFQDLWVQVNRTASQSLVAFLEADQSSALSVQNGQLVLDIGPIVENVKQQLVDQGFSLAEKIPTVNKDVILPVANVDQIVKAKQAVNAFRTLSYVFPIVAIICFALAIFLARDRRRAVIWVGGLLAAGALLSGVFLASGRSAFLANRPGTVFDENTAASMFDTLTRFLRNSNRVTFFIGLILALVAAFSGPYAWAVKTRGMVSGAITEGGSKTGWDTGAFGAFFARHRRGWLIGIALLYAIVVVLWTQPTPAVLFWLLVAALVLVALGIFFAATAPDESTHAGSVDAGDGGAAPDATPDDEADEKEPAGSA
jgi:hypothetical protein